MTRTDLGLKAGLILGGVHLALVLLAWAAVMQSRSSTAGLVFLWFFFADAPVLLLFPTGVLKVLGTVGPLVQFGFFGSCLWFLIPWLTDRAVLRVFPKATRAARVISIIGAVPLVLSLFVPMERLSIRRSIQRERPEELAARINTESSDFLTGTVILEQNAPVDISSIARMNCRPGAGVEIVLGLASDIVFLDTRYTERFRLNLPGAGFKTLESVHAGEDGSCRYIGYRLWKGVHLLDSNGRELWAYLSADAVTGVPDGVRAGDVDGDGIPEFVLYARYRQGVTLLDQEGHMRWNHPIYALGHVDMADTDGNGAEEIIYSNSNNADGITIFTVLDSDGRTTKQIRLITPSSEFAVIPWPETGEAPNLVVTEEGRMRVVDLGGNTVRLLDAPGCRPFGEMKAVTIRFRENEARFLAIRKNLHPDLSVLYVYDPRGELVFQKTEVVEGVLSPVLAAVPETGTGRESLLMASPKGYGATVMVYSGRR